MTRYTADSRDRVLDAVDMLSLVGSRLELRRAGVDSYFGICPFHDERTGSFHVRPDEKQLVDVVNERFLRYVVRPRFDKYLDAAALGPGIGSTSTEIIRRRFGSRFDATVVAKSMICASCHKADGLGSLNWPMDRVVISSYIKGGQMPFGSELSLLERAELYRKLIQDYFATDEANPGVLKSWLLGKLRQRQAASSNNR